MHAVIYSEVTLLHIYSPWIYQQHSAVSIVARGSLNWEFEYSVGCYIAMNSMENQRTVALNQLYTCMLYPSQGNALHSDSTAVYAFI